MRLKIASILAVVLIAWLSADVLADELTLDIKEGEVVEWRTVSKEAPVCDMNGSGIGCAVMHYTMCNQIGIKYTTKYIEVKWNEETKALELERTMVETTDVLERKIICSEDVSSIFSR